MKKEITQSITRFQHTRIFRAFLRFSRGRGPLLAAGIAYMGLFSITAAITVGWTAFSGILASHPALKQSVIDAVNNQIPGLLRSPHHPGGLVDPDSLVATPGMSLAGWIAAALTVVTASTVIWYLGLAIRSMFGLSAVPEPLKSAIPRRFLGLFALLFAVLLVAILTGLATFLRSWVVEHIGIANGRLFDVSVLVVPLAIDYLAFIISVRLVAAVRPPRRDLALGALLAAIGSFALRTLGTTVIGHVSSPVLATATSLVTVMLWMNFLGWITLYAAAWTSNPPLVLHPRLASSQYSSQRPNYVTMSAPHTLGWVRDLQ